LSNLTVSRHYDASYFAWQQQSGRLGGFANVDKFRASITPVSKILDFGCGGGYLLASVDCAARFGVEPNPSARTTAAQNGVEVFASSAEALRAMGPESIDVIVSDNALEHTLEPWRELSTLRTLLKRGGRLHIVVPCEGIGMRFKSGNIDRHLYSWSPQCLGNLIEAAGFELVYARPYIHKWPPRISRLLAKLGRPVFNLACRFWGHIDRRWFQVEALAMRPLLDQD